MDRHTLKEAVDAGLGGVGRVAGPHVDAAQLYELLTGAAGSSDGQLNHLFACPVCARLLREMAQDLAAADATLAGWDLALPKAAASSTSDACWRIPTEAGRYTIEVHPHVSDPSRGLVSLRVAPKYREELEGRHVSLHDMKGRLLLAGKVVGGEVAQMITDLDQIEPGFVVRAE